MSHAPSPFEKKTRFEEYVIGCVLSDSDLYLTEKLDTQWFSGRNKEMIEALEKYKGEHDVFDELIFSALHGFTLSEIMNYKGCFPSIVNYPQYVEYLKKISYANVLVKSLTMALDDLQKQPEECEVILSRIQSVNLGLISEKTYESAMDVSNQIRKNVEDVEKTGKEPFASIGIDTLDEYIQLMPSQLILIGARPGVGKSTFALNIARKLLRFAPVSFVGFEMSNVEVHIRMLIRDAQKTRNMLYGPNGKDILDQTIKANTEFYNRLTYCDMPMSIERLEQVLTIQKNKFHIEYAFVDYVGLLTTEQKTQNEYSAMKIITRQLKQMAQKLKICIFALSQLSRDIEKRTDKAFRLSDLRDSGSLEQDANIVIFLKTEKDNDNGPFKSAETHTIPKDQMEVHICKSRDGKIGMVKLRYLPELYYIDSK